MTDKEFIEAYPYSIKAWEAQRKPVEYLITGDERMFYDFQVSEYAYWFNLNRNEELYGKIKELEKELALRTEWTNHHKKVSEIDAQKKHDAEAKVKELEVELDKTVLDYNAASESSDRWRSQYFELEEKLAEAVTHLENMLEPQERKCRYDHNRNCQEHSWFGLDGEDCPVSQAFDFIEEIKAE